MKRLILLVLAMCLALSAVSSAAVLREIWWGGGSIDEAIALVIPSVATGILGADTGVVGDAGRIQTVDECISVIVE